jgi:signal transduction histidine kinase
LLENIGLYIENFSGTSYTDEENNTLRRFGKVFQQTYTRFLDLQKAEANARESQIQLALEKVRARTMAMQRSEELQDAALVLIQQVGALGVEPFACGFNIWDEDRKEATAWMARDNSIQPAFKTCSTEDIFLQIYEASERGESLFVKEQAGKELEVHYDYMNSIPIFRESALKMAKAGFSIPSFQIMHCAFFAQGYLMFITHEPCPGAHDIFIRFAKVFEQTYTRFLDLQKSESQAKEAQIEAALERVRSRSMGMQKTDELKDVIQVIYTQLVHLNIRVDQAGFVMDYKETEAWNIWIADQIGVPSRSYIPYFDSPQWNRFNEAKQKGEDSFTNNLTFEEKNQFFQMIFEYVSGVPDEVKEFIFSTPGFATSNALLKYVCLFVNNFSGIQYSNEENAIVMRFARVFEQTYIRFNDLKQAEALARETVQRASVDRVRAEIASMRTTTDLERITPLIWNELTTIGVPFIRCGVFIMDEEHQQVNTFLSTPEGNGVAASFHLPYNASPETMEIVGHWKRKEMYRPHWDEAAFIDFTTALIERGAVTTGEKFLVESRPTDLYLHFLPFQQGMLYVGDNSPLSDEHLQLVQALAEAFSTAYARYEDFNNLETAKAQIEKTLTDLRQAQAQLVQSEKMASLGELTAGIAHEIQNPLNFVNNFSEINRELISEMKEEMETGNLKEATEIAAQIDDNEKKILHHGKRADAIVKGMLQHSQSGTGKQEPTDINALADEYLRLAFHGLRAKEKSFNAAMNTDFDESIGLIPLISQDIGRVLLNLYNNAFYAVHEKKKAMNGAYEPTVSLCTRRIENEVEIRVRDNGKGISRKIKDKIFQPFFTTKPTGQGTGLGLSLSYDIVKAHGGEIEVITTEGEFTEFIIHLKAG